MKYHTTHSIICEADAKAVFSLLSDVSRWPDIMEPCKKARLVERVETSEIIELTADVNGMEMTWKSERKVYPDILRIESNIFQPMEPAKSMWTTWQVYSINKAKCLLMLNNDYDIKKDVGGLIPGVEDTIEAEFFLNQAIDFNSTTELRNIKTFIEQTDKKMKSNPSNYYSFTKACPVSASEAYQCLKNTTRWAGWFSNCEKIEVLSRTKECETIHIWGYQDRKLIDWITKRVYMDESYRIVYNFEKQMPLLSEMHGEWQVIPIDEKNCMISANRYWAIKKEVDNPLKAKQIMYGFVSTNTENEFNAIVSKLRKIEKVNVMIKSLFVPFKPTEIYEFMSDLNKWKEYIPHCNTLNIIYDDGINQIFTMSGSKSEEFQSVRVCENVNLKIKYFQPSPPPLLKYHTGEWIFLNEWTGTTIIFRHEYIINLTMCKKYFVCEDYVTCNKKIEEILEKNSYAAIKSCTQYLRKKGN